VNKHIIPIMVILLLLSSGFVGVSAIPSTGNVSIEKPSTVFFDGDTLYVGGSGPGNYTKIQDAIDNASDGGTVFVYNNSSPYYENVVVDKSINLIGENRETTVIDGSGINDVVYISADEVIISKFTIQNSGDLGWQNDHDAGIDIHSQYGVISNNNILNNHHGIVSRDSCNNTYSNNTLSQNEAYGLVLWDDGNNNIVGNHFLENQDGILISYAGYNKVLNNVFVSNGRFGIAVTRSQNTVSGNTFFNDGLYIEASTNNISNNIVNGKPLIYLEKETNKSVEEPAGQIILVRCHNIIIRDQQINNTYNGIQLLYSNNCQISNSTLLNNKNAGISLKNSNNNTISNTSLISNGWLGSSVFFSENNTFFGNTISKNKVYGLWLIGLSDGTMISNNIVEKNGGGICLSKFNEFCPNNNVISGNNIIHNDYGIMLSSSNNAIYHNTLVNNIQNAYDFCSNIWDDDYPSGGNYWSDYTGGDYYHGPDQNLTGPDGIGDTPYPIPDGNNEDMYPLMEPWGGNQPPDPPSITGPTSGKPRHKYNYTFFTIDPDGDDVYYFIDWGDLTDSGWIGPFASGEEVIVSHKWLIQGSYTIRAKVKDIYDVESDWATLEVAMPKNQQYSNMWFLWFLERFPNAFPILKKVFSYIWMI